MDRSFAVRLGRPLLLAPSRRAIRTCLGVAPAIVLLLGAWGWLRDSSLVSVDHVRVSGVQGVDAGAIESALTRAARHMSTMHVHIAALRAAVAPYPVVRDLRVSPSFPHGLKIQVIEQPPVAVLTSGSTRTAVAATGVILGPGFLSNRLPVIHATPPSGGGERVSSAPVLAELAALGAAPETLIGWVARVYTGHNGVTVAMRNGLLLYFGDGARPHAKWLSAARVLADHSSAGASYVDVRVPERPAAGIGATGVSSAAGSGSGQVSASDPTAAALAAALAGAVKAGDTSTADIPPEGSTAAKAAAPETQTGAGASTGAPVPETPRATGVSPTTGG